MLWPTALMTLILLTSQLSTGVYGDIIGKFGRGDTVEGAMKRYADALVEGLLERRQSLPSKMNVTLWDEQTAAACNSSLMALNGFASNPAGMAVCYNLPYLDNSTGLFQADLRLYMISVPTGDFSGVPPQNVTVGLQYFGASVQTINPSELKRDLVFRLSRRGGIELERRAVMTPSLIQAYAFVGQINKDLMTANMNASALQALLIPVVTLSALTSTGSTVDTTLSSTEATFVTGVFSDQVNATAVAATAASASATAAVTPFVLPGTKILIFPIGAIITGTWAALGVATVAYGTVGRIRFREHHRSRLARAEKRALGRI